MMKTFRVTVEKTVHIDVDFDNDITQEYANEQELIEDLVSYDFESVLPVIQSGGVKVMDSMVDEYHYFES